MEHDSEALIARLSPEIDRKCAEIRHNRVEKSYLRLFVLLCVLAVMLPTMFVFFGISLTALRTAITFTGAAFVLLSPILINQQGGHTHEQAR